MPQNVCWIIQNHILYIQYSGEVKLNDIRESSIIVSDYLEVAYQEAPDNLIIGVVDMREANLDSIFWSALSIIVKQVADVIDPRIWKAKPGFSVLITESGRAKTIISLMIKIKSQPMTTVDTMDEAIINISSMYPELNEQLEAYRIRNLPSGATS